MFTRCRIKDKFRIIEADQFINTAGLYTLNLAKYIEPEAFIEYTNYYVKGHYYSYSKKLAVDKLYYLLPSVLGLGVHLTLDLTNKIRIGPSTHVTEFLEDYLDSTDEKKFKGYVR